MKRTLNSDRKKGVKWDEENLEENEKIKLELNPTKITEPKTPYWSPMDTDDELDLEGAGMSPLSLEDEGPASKRSNGGGWSDSDKNTGSSPQASPSWEKRSPRFNDYYKDDSDTADANDAGSQEKRRRFMELRKKHYNMREALKKTKDVAAPADEDAGAEADVEEDSEPAARAAANGQLHAAAADQHACEAAAGGDSSS